MENEKSWIITGEVRMDERGSRRYSINITLPGLSPMNCIHVIDDDGMSKMRDSLHRAAKDIEHLMSIGRVPTKKGSRRCRRRRS